MSAFALGDSMASLPPPQPYRDRRPDGLGDLRVLPDETICAILDLLSPPDLARLACVSSVMYILCNEEPLWMSQCLRVGGPLEYKGTWKKTALYRQNLCTENGLQKHLEFDGFNSLFLYRRWYRCFTTLDVFSLDNGSIERKTNLTLEEFHSNFDGKMPVLITELANTWPARTKWTIDQLSSNYGNVAFRISQRTSKKITMTLKDYVSYMEIQHDEDPLYIFDEKFGEAAPSLLDDYSVPHLFQDDYFDVLDADKRPAFRWLIIGPERSGASWHVDPALTSAWNTLLCGRKRWALYPPGRVPAGVTVHVNEEDGDINIESPTSLQWWLDIYPQLADHDKPIECTQLPGETIFVPSGWWHCVLNLEKTVAVTQNFVNASNFQFVCLDLAPGHRHKGVSRAGFLALQDHEIRGGRSYECREENLLDEPDTSRKVKRQKVLVTEKESFRYNGNWNATDLPLLDPSKKENESFSYDIEFLSTFLDLERDHYNSIWSSSNCIGQREMREWLHKLWISKPAMRQLIWKGAELALDGGKWYLCVLEICTHHNLPPPSDDEKLPVGSGSNPVFLVSDYAIKIYAEGGFSSSIHSLGTELEFYQILQNAKSPLIGHVPDVLAGGVIVKEDGFFRVFPWDGKGIPDVCASGNLASVAGTGNLFPFGLWSKKKVELSNVGVSSGTNIWPYIVTKRCKGDILANIRDSISREDALELARFLGDQLRNLHLLPLPQMEPTNHSNVKLNSLARSVKDLVEGFKAPFIHAIPQETMEYLNISPDWELILAALDEKKRNIKKRLSLWGSPIPEHLIEKVEEYIPHELAMLLDLTKDNDGLYKVSGFPTWIHSDIMDDNIHMEPCSSTHCFEGSAHSTANGKLDVHNVEGRQGKWKATYIIDFSNLSVGDPLFDLIPIYFDVFRGDVFLLKQFLTSYKLPLARTSAHGALSFRLVENSEKFKRISYRAMCYCILHDENVLGAVFTLWKELRTASSWEEVEAAVWGELNTYQCSC